MHAEVKYMRHYDEECKIRERERKSATRFRMLWLWFYVLERIRMIMTITKILIEGIEPCSVPAFLIFALVRVVRACLHKIVGIAGVVHKD